MNRIKGKDIPCIDGGEIVKLYRIAHQGAPVVNTAHVVSKHDDIALIRIDMKSKYCEVSATGSVSQGGKDPIPMVMIAANERALYIKKNKFIDDETRIEFPGMIGYTVIATGNGRYDIAVCFVNLSAVRERA